MKQMYFSLFFPLSTLKTLDMIWKKEKKTMGEKSEVWDPGTNKVMNSLGFHFLCSLFLRAERVSKLETQMDQDKTKQSKKPAPF